MARSWQPRTSSTAPTTAVSAPPRQVAPPAAALAPETVTTVTPSPTAVAAPTETAAPEAATAPAPVAPAANTVTYQVTGLPAGATFDAETMELVWTPGYAQAGSYSITVTATDDGDGTGTPAVSHLVLPIVVGNANRAPDIGDITNASSIAARCWRSPSRRWTPTAIRSRSA